MAILPALSAFAGNSILYDFEHSAEGWEHEAAQPDAVVCSSEQYLSGQQSLACAHFFGKGRESVTLRVKEGFPRDFSEAAGFRGFALSIYLSKRGFYEARMFVRSGPNWTWTTGEPVSFRGKDWVRLEISREVISDPSTVQDLGVVVSSSGQDVETVLFVDKVELLAD